MKSKSTATAVRFFFAAVRHLPRPPAPAFVVLSLFSGEASSLDALFDLGERPRLHDRSLAGVGDAIPAGNHGSVATLATITRLGGDASCAAAAPSSGVFGSSAFAVPFAMGADPELLRADGSEPGGTVAPPPAPA